MKRKHLKIGEGVYPDLRELNNNEVISRRKNMTSTNHFERQNTHSLRFFLNREYTDVPNFLWFCLKIKKTPEDSCVRTHLNLTKGNYESRRIDIQNGCNIWGGEGRERERGTF